VIVLIIVGFLVWYFFLESAPKSYSECLKAKTNDYTGNELNCSYSPRTPAIQKICEEKGGIINQFKECLISYYNPEFKFPKNLAECGSKIGFIDTNKTTCDIYINKKGSYDSLISNRLFNECKQNGGQVLYENSCWIRFTPNGIKF
jgi:hypothetical protein